MPLSRPVERAVAEGVSTVLADRIEVDLWAETFPDALGRMFQELLAEAPAWSHYWWIDDALPERVKQLDDATVEIAGIFVPGDERNQWIQPFRASLRIDSTRTRVVGYHVSLGEEGIAIDAVPWGARRPKHWPDVERWAYVFAEPTEDSTVPGDKPGH